jgi:hypothetical protein
MNTTFGYALEYYHKNFSVIPIISKDKRPAVTSWEENKTTRADEKQIREWFLNGGSYNIAIVTGSISQIVAFDIDGDAAEEYFYRIVEELDDSIKNIIHNTTTMKTGSGNTNLIIGFNPQDFQEDEKIKNTVLWHSNDDKHAEIRLKAEGGYIIVPPSIHPNGNKYELLNGISSIVLSRKQLEMLIVALRSSHKEKCSSSSSGNNDRFYQLNDEAINKIASILKPYYKGGQRNDFILYLSGWLRKRGVEIERVKKVIALLSDGDEERQNRIRTLKETYAKDNQSRIKGYSGLLVLLTEQLQDEQKAFDTLKRIEQILPEKDEKDEKEDTLQLVSKSCLQFFLDQYGSPYAAVRLSDHVETMAMNGKRIRNWICKIKYDATNILLSSETLASVLNVLRAKAEFENNTRNLYLRVAESDKEPFVIYYDLTNSRREVVKITPIRWSIEKSPILFRRYGNQLMQPHPSISYPFNIFDQFIELLNVKNDDNKLLLKCYIISLFIPEIPKPVLMLHGEQGSAKSTLLELIKMLVDPSILRTLSFSKNNDELVQKLSHNYISYFDNVSDIRNWISDQLCRAVTGSGFSKRELYTDDDDIIYNFRRCIGFNGINLAATKADLLDRGLIIQLERISEEQRRTIEDIWKDFEKIRPLLLGYIFDILVRVMKKKSEGGIKMKSHPRMADFAEVAEIISRIMGNMENKFLEVYHRNIGLQTEQALESSPIAATIIEFMNSRTEWTGTTTELLNELEQVAEILKIKTKNNKEWPTAPNRLSRRINDIKTNLRQIGIVIERYTNSKTNTRIIDIRKVSYLSPVSPKDADQARFSFENSGDKNKIPLPVSPAARAENPARNSSSGDTCDTGDTIPTSLTSHRLGNSDTWGTNIVDKEATNDS